MKTLASAFLLLLVAVLSGCLYPPPMMISQPSHPQSSYAGPAADQPPATTSSGRPIIVQPVRPIRQGEVYRPDPTYGFITNNSDRVYKRYWIDTLPPSRPTLELSPGASWPIFLMLGKHNVLIRGRMKNEFGWVDLGEIPCVIVVGTNRDPGSEFSMNCRGNF